MTAINQSMKDDMVMLPQAPRRVEKSGGSKKVGG